MGKYSFGLEEFAEQRKNLLLSMLSEFVGLFMLVLFGVASCISNDKLLISLTFALVVFAVIISLHHVSGTHINPAITIALMAIGKVSVLKTVLYVIAQCAGGAAGMATLHALLPANITAGTFGHNRINPIITEFQAVGIEFFLGFILILVVVGVVDDNKPETKPLAALAIGLTVGFGHTAMIEYTGASMNPARTFGSAVLTGDWENHWVYWVGPCLGGIVAALLYHHCFRAKATHKYEPAAVDVRELRSLKTRDDVA